MILLYFLMFVILRIEIKDFIAELIEDFTVKDLKTFRVLDLGTTN